MLFQKGTDFVEITQAISADTNETVWYVYTNLDWEKLPVEFRVQVSETDQEGLEKLKNALVEWADRKGFKLVLKI
jgi:translation initiation factor 2 alpha subunit (eIF-2alpha)